MGKKKIIWNITFFVLITIVVTGLPATLQQKMNLEYEKIVLPQLAPAIAFLIITLVVRSLRIPIVFDINKNIAVKSLLASGLPLLLLNIAWFIGKLNGSEVKKTNDLTPLISIMLMGIILERSEKKLGGEVFCNQLSKKTIQY